MVVSDVRFLDDCTAFIKKDKQLMGVLNPVVGVSLRDNVVIVAHMHVSIDSVPLIMLVKECDTFADAMKTFYKVIGKMCKKEASSKYFDNTRSKEHMVNGNPRNSDAERKNYMIIAGELKRIYKEKFE